MQTWKSDECSFGVSKGERCKVVCVTCDQSSNCRPSTSVHVEWRCSGSARQGCLSLLVVVSEVWRTNKKEEIVLFVECPVRGRRLLTLVRILEGFELPGIRNDGQ